MNYEHCDICSMPIKKIEKKEIYKDSYTSMEEMHRIFSASLLGMPQQQSPTEFKLKFNTNGVMCDECKRQFDELHKVWIIQRKAETMKLIEKFKV